MSAFIIWQQPHVIYMSELIYRARPSQEFLREYADMVRADRRFMKLRLLIMILIMIVTFRELVRLMNPIMKRRPLILLLKWLIGILACP